MVEFSRWLAYTVVAQHAISETECPCEHLLSALCKRLEAARVCAIAARISMFAKTTLKNWLVTTLCGDGRWRGHHSVDPSERRTERTLGSFAGPGRANCKARARGCVPPALGRRNSFRRRLRFARNGGHHRNARRIGGSCLSDRGSFEGLFCHFLVVVLRENTLEPRLI